jgi:predicted metallo-beta-lactamase superfamily hydrolase
MLKHIRVTPLAAESLGVRSMCTYVETPDAKILLDAGVSLCPNRFGLPPHPKEFKAIIESRKRIAQAADNTEHVTISHYHFDHHTPSYEDWLTQWTDAAETARQIYQNKTVLAKNARETINPSQRRRGWMFGTNSGSYAKRIENADGKTYTQGKTQMAFSEPVPHGEENSALGWVLMTTVVYEDEKFMFAPDVQGPMSTHTLELILGEKPQLLMLGGPPLYLPGFKVSEAQVQEALRNLEKIVRQVPIVVLEHHILRDASWHEKTSSVFHEAHVAGHTVLTAAKILGKPDCCLEAKRKSLFEEEPPSGDFRKWMRKSEEIRARTKPPI